MQDYYSFKEFAEAAKVSQQSLYKAKKLQPYIITIDGVKKISRAALELYQDRAVEQPLNKVESEPMYSHEEGKSKETLNNLEQPLNNASEMAIRALQNSLDIISRQLDDKQRTIEQQQETIKELKDIIDSDREEKKELRLLLNQQQHLTAIDKVEKHQEKEEDIIAAAAAPVEHEASPQAETEPTPPPTIVKPKGFFKKLAFAFSKDE